MARKRSHRNTTRLTAKERAHDCLMNEAVLTSSMSSPDIDWLEGQIQRAIQAAVRQALARKNARMQAKHDAWVKAMERKERRVK